MMIDGRQIAREIQERLREKVALLEHRPVLALVVVGDNPVTERFIHIKKKFAEKIGVHIEEHRFTDAITTDTLLEKVEDIALDETIHGVVVQLPLPVQIDLDSILSAIPPQKDVDMLAHDSVVSYESDEMPTMMPPVVGAISEIVSREHIDIVSKKAVVVGRGILVGAPVAQWLRTQGADVCVLGKGDDVEKHTGSADIIVLGAGVPHMIQPNMVRKDVVIFDAGVSEVGGSLKGDADPRCADICRVFTPVPGGIGPITVAILFRNLISGL